MASSALLLVACSSAATPDTFIPTSTLVPPSATPPPVTPVPTETSIPAIRAASLVDLAPPSLETIDDEQERQTAILVYQDLIERRTEQGLIGDVRLIALEATLWSNARLLGCPKTSTPDTVAGYRIVFVSDDFIYEYHTGPDAALRFCSQRDVTEAEDDLLLLVDPVATEIFTLAQQRLSRERDIPSRRVELVSMSRVTWTDSSLGCSPDDTSQPSQAVITDGYRLVVKVGQETVIFHTDSESIRQCAVEDERLPDAALSENGQPSPTPAQ